MNGVELAVAATRLKRRLFIRKLQEVVDTVGRYQALETDITPSDIVGLLLEASHLKANWAAQHLACESERLIAREEFLSRTTAHDAKRWLLQACDAEDGAAAKLLGVEIVEYRRILQEKALDGGASCR